MQGLALHRGIRILALAAVALACLSCGEGSRKDEPRAHDTGLEVVGPPEAVVAVVNGEPITLAEVNLLAWYWLERTAPETRRSQKRAELQRRALQELIDQQVLVQEARRLGVAASDSLIAAQIKQWEAQVQSPEQLQRRFERSHITPESVREHLRRDLLIQGLVRKSLANRGRVTEEEARAYYAAHPEHFDGKTVRASHILLEFDRGAPAESLSAVRTRARALRERARAGEDFAALARRYSSCPSSAQGGDLGAATRGRWVKPFEEAAFALQPGEVSDVVVSDFGLHIIRVADVSENWVSFAEAGEAIRQQLGAAALQAAVDSLAQSLRAAARIELRLETAGATED